jgi:hypothetical protein
MIADPDTLLVKDLGTEEARVSATIIALPGQLTFFGDKLGGLSKAQMKILRQCLPAINVYPEQLYPFFSLLPVWNLRIGHKVLGAYNAVAFFNWEDKIRTISVDAAELGLDRETAYTAWEFWTGKTIPRQAAVFSVEVPPHGVRVVSIHREENFPQWIGSDRHISLSGMEVSRWKWNGNSKKITGALRCVGGFPLATAIRVPGNFRFVKAACKSAACTVKDEGGFLTMVMQSEKTGELPFTLEFK